MGEPVSCSGIRTKRRSVDDPIPQRGDMAQVNRNNRLHIRRIQRGGIVLGVFGMWVLAAVWTHGSMASLSAQQPRTVRDGIFTEEQSTRGQATYQMNCASCH